MEKMCIHCRVKTDALLQAVRVIKQWHNGYDRIKNEHAQEEAWEIYYKHSPEMEMIRVCLGVNPNLLILSD